MSPTDPDRGQVVVVEVLLLLVVLIIAFGLYQGYGVPDQNFDAEFEHNHDLQSDLVDYRNSLVEVRDHDRVTRWHQSTTIRLGLSYPPRILAINPPNPQGALTTRSYGDIEIDGAEVEGWFYGNPQERLLDTSHETMLLVYTPSYNEYQNAPETVFEHSLLYNDFETGHGPLTGQRSINGENRELNLVLYDQELTRTTPRATLEPRTLDGPTATVPIEPTDGSIELTLPTRNPGVWTDIIGESYDSGEEHARVSNTEEQAVTVELDGEWELKMALVGYHGGATQEAFSAIQPMDRQDIPLLSLIENTEDTTGQDVHFDVENEAPETATITAVGVETDLASIFNRGGGEPEISISGGTATGSLNTGPGGGNALDADGTLYDLDDDAVIEPGQQASVEIGDFDTTFQELMRTDDPSRADLTVLMAAEERDDPLEFHFIVDPEPSLFEVTITDTNDPVAEGETLEVTAEVANTGDLPATQDLELEISDGVGIVDTAELSLTGGSVENVTLEWETGVGDAGEYTITVASDDDADTQSAMVYDPNEPIPAYFAVTIDEFDEEVAEGEPVDVEVTVENTGGATATQSVLLNVDRNQDGDFDHEADSESVTLEGGEQSQLTLTYVTEAGDQPAVDIEVRSNNDREMQTVSVLPPVFTQLDVIDIETGAQNAPDAITLEYEVTGPVDITFTAEEANGDTATAIHVNSDSGTVVLDLPSVGNNDFPVVLEADIATGECLTVTVEDGNDLKDLTDWEPC